MAPSPAKATPAIAALSNALSELSKLEFYADNNDKVLSALYNRVHSVRQDLAKYVSEEWDKSRTMECGAD